MAQGAIKQKKSDASKKSKPLGPQKGSRVIAPKKKKLIEQQKMAKKISSGLTAKTEKTLAERAGHLELLAGGKKSKASAAEGAKAGKRRGAK